MAVFEEKTPFEKGFDTHWQAIVAPHLESYKILYKQFSRIGYWATLAAIIIGVGAWFAWDNIFQYGSEDSKAIFALVILTLELGLLIGGWWKLYRLADDPLDLVMQAVEAHFGAYFAKDENTAFASLQAAHFRDEGLTEHGNIEISEHYAGAYRGCRIRFYTANHSTKDTTTSRRTLEEKMTGRSESHMNYLIFSISVPFDFSGETRIETDKGAIRNKLRSVSSGFTQYKVPDKKFEKAFEVFTNDAAGTEKLITPSFADSMLTVKSFYKKQKGGRLACQFKDKHFTMAVREGGHFTHVGTGHYAPSQIEGLARTLIKRFATILQLVDMLHGDKPAA